MMRLIRFLLLCLLIGTMFGWQPSPIYACEPLSPEQAAQATHTRRTEAADMVLEGTITDTAGGSAPHTATVEVDVYYKGSGPAEVTITGFGEGPDCLSPVAEGEHLIFYANGDPAGTLNAYYLVGLDAVTIPGTDVVAEIEAAAGQEPIEPAGDSEPTFGLSNYLLLAAGTLCLLVVGAGGFFLAYWLRRSPRP
jgi:hypothetical protein